ncbi:MAG: hypothetical protein U5L07_05730 [Desulfobacterales bacterium]|nr:hypothetical protein [Desulfobacterales bacterium]
MNFEILFLFIIVGIMLFTQILKQMARKTAKGDKKPSSGWRKGLENLLEEFRQEMEPQKESAEPLEQPARHRSWWEDLMPEESPAKQAESEQVSAESKGKTAASEEAASAEKEKQWQKRGFKKWEPRSFAREAAPEKVKKVPHPAKQARLSRQDLRQAVIWSEILAPPAGLRGPKT